MKRTINDIRTKGARNKEERMHYLIANFLGLETRADFREYNKGNIIDLDFNLNCDLAFIRCQFKRYLRNNNIKTMKLVNSMNYGYRFLGNEDINTLEGLNKVINNLKLALDEADNSYYRLINY